MASGAQSDPAPPTRGSRPANLPALTGLRFFAAAIVVLHHTWGLFLPETAPPLVVAHGYLGVPFFFVLSGYVFGHVYLADGARSRIPARPFFAARVARLVPLYVLALALSAPFVLAWFLHSSGVSAGLGKAAASLAVNLGFAGAWLPFAAGPWNPPGWSLSVEVVFYVAFPWLGPRLARLGLARLTLLAIGLHAATLASALGFAATLETSSWSAALLERAPLLHLHEFVIGVATARLVAAAAPSPGLAAGLTLGGLVACGGALTAWPAEASRLLLHDGATAVAFAALIAGVAASRGRLERVLGSRAAVLMGDASYAVYLLHIPLLFWFFLAAPGSAMALHESPAPHAGNAPLAYLTYGVGVLALSTVSFLWIETPLRRRIRRRLTPVDRPANAPVAADPQHRPIAA